jgi:uncharacterized protein (UPF0128 family)
MDSRKQKLRRDRKMRETHSGTVIGYDANSGKKLFEETNRATQLPDGASALPKAGDKYENGGKNYRIKGIRKGSTETLCLMDVIEE